MSGELIWRPLPLVPSPGLPVLLVAVDIGTATYTIRVTDMANIWVENLDRKAICMRGWSENTSIDPSDTPENMAKFLSSLRSALDPSQPGHDQTSLTLSPGSKKEAGDDGLTLKITCPLPGFQPLRWPIHLKKSPPSTIATDLVLPLIGGHYTRKLEVDSLIRALSYKDSVIAKLADKLEATGTGLENIFTALSGRKKVTRTLAEEKVKGLALFDKQKWRASLNQSQDLPASASDLVLNVFEGDGLPSKSMMQVDASPELDKWWHDFKSTSQQMHRSQQTAVSLQRTPSPLPANSAVNDDDDDFEVQATPPHLRSGKNDAATSNAAPPDDMSTEDEDDIPTIIKDIPFKSSDIKREPDAKKPMPRMGAIGGKNQFPAPQSPKPSESGSRQSKTPAAVDDSETASDAETASLPDDASPPPPPPPKAPPRKGGLGKIGGAVAKAPVEEKAKSLEAEENTTTTKVESSPPRRKLGVIGKIGGATSAKPAVAADGAGRGRVPVREETQADERPRETSQERADRRREELKRELEKKTAAGPAKKKRRF
ncbi:hypothetical protein PT974_05992 [Cladobotryum mycophilum]|uniref:Non-homologous end-joining factor 1 n=1 Tax=Cladobotryum mycophilum TaxID=491253 RepID=A0ABR0SK98_9HYPO